MHLYVEGYGLACGLRNLSDATRATGRLSYTTCKNCLRVLTAVIAFASYQRYSRPTSRKHEPKIKGGIFL